MKVERRKTLLRGDRRHYFFEFTPLCEARHSHGVIRGVTGGTADCQDVSQPRPAYSTELTAPHIPLQGPVILGRECASRQIPPPAPVCAFPSPLARACAHSRNPWECSRHNRLTTQPLSLSCLPRSTQHAGVRYAVKMCVITARQIMHTAGKRRRGRPNRSAREKVEYKTAQRHTTCDRNAPEKCPSAAIIYYLGCVGWEGMNSRSLAEETLCQACSGRSNVIFMGENIKRSCPGCRKDDPFRGKAHGARSVYFRQS